jgi:hypothetical protein
MEVVVKDSNTSNIKLHLSLTRARKLRCIIIISLDTAIHHRHDQRLQSIYRPSGALRF